MQAAFGFSRIVRGKASGQQSRPIRTHLVGQDVILEQPSSQPRNHLNGKLISPRTFQAVGDQARISA